MKKIGKRISLLSLAAVMAGTLLSGCGKLQEDDIVATVGKYEIAGNVANFYVRYQQAQFETYYAGMLGGANEMWDKEVSDGKTYEDNIKDSAMDSLEQLYILKDHVKEYKIELTDEEKAKIESVAKKFMKDNGLKAKEAVSASKEAVAEVLTLMTISQKMNTAMTAKVSTEVADEEAAQKSMQYVSYPFTSTDESGKSATVDDAGKAELKKKADALAEGAKAAADFAVYAKEQGSEAQTVTFDAKSTSPDAALIKAADALAAGETTGVVESENGYYVAKVTSLLDRKATDAKKATIVTERKQVEFDKIYQEWKKKTDIKVNKKNWAKIDFTKQGVTVKQSDEKPYTE